MKLTNKQLKQIIKEELQNVLNENKGYGVKLSRLIDQGDVATAVELGSQFLDHEDVYEMFVNKIAEIAHDKNPGPEGVDKITKIASMFQGKDERVNQELDRVISGFEQGIERLQNRKKLARSSHTEYSWPLSPEVLETFIAKLKKAKAGFATSLMPDTYSGSNQSHVYVDDPMMETKK